MYFIIKLKHVYKHKDHKEQRRVRWTQPAHKDETNKERNHPRKGWRHGTEYNIQCGLGSTATDADPDAQLPTQLPQANPVRRMETPTPMLPPGPYRPLTPRMPLPTSPTSSSQPSQSSAPLFKEDKYSSTSEEETEADAEVTFINDRNQPNRTFTHNSTMERPTSTLTTTDYTTQGDPDVSPSTPNLFRSTARYRISGH